jgi:hypothetical protein
MWGEWPPHIHSHPFVPKLPDQHGFLVSLLEVSFYANLNLGGRIICHFLLAPRIGIYVGGSFVV